MSECRHGLDSQWCEMCSPKPPPLHGRALWAEQVFSLIPSEDAEEWISGSELAISAGLTSSQVAAGVAYLRDSFPEFPLISGPAGYRFSIDAAEVATFRRWRARSAHTTVRRLWRGVIKPYVEHAAAGGPTSLEARQTAKQFDRLLEDIADLTA